MHYKHRGRPNLPHPAGDPRKASLRVDFDRRLKLELHGSKITSDAGLLAYRELDEALGLCELAGAALSDLLRGKNTRHLLRGLLRQSRRGTGHHHHEPRRSPPEQRRRIIRGQQSARTLLSQREKRWRQGGRS